MVAAAPLLVAALAIASCGKPKPAATADDPATTPANPATGALITIPETQRDRLRIQAVEVTTFRPTLHTTGTVAFNADVSTQVISPLSGPVLRVLAEPGTEVKRGQAIAEVSSPDFAQAVAAFRKAQGAAEQASRVLEQNEALWKNDAIARRDLDQSRTDALSAGADRDAALQALRSLGVDSVTIASLASGKVVGGVPAAIRAPINGTVVEKLITPGQLLTAGGTVCFTIADLETMWVLANVFGPDLGAVHVGDAVDVVTSASGAPLHGAVSYIASLVDPATNATAVRVVVPNTGHALKRDMYVETTIHSTVARRGILVPVTAVLRDEDNLPFTFVETPGGSGRFGRRSLTLGTRLNDRYEITAGLTAGERIITEGALFVQFAQTQ